MLTTLDQEGIASAVGVPKSRVVPHTHAFCVTRIGNHGTWDPDLGGEVATMPAIIKGTQGCCIE